MTIIEGFRAMDEIGRELPSSNDAEQALLGGLMLNNAAFDDVADTVGEKDFFRVDHQIIFGGMRILAKASEPFDPITIADTVKLQDWAYVVGLARNTGTATNVRHYARIVRNKSLERGLLLAADEINRTVYEHGDVREKIDHVASVVGAITDQRTVIGPRTMRELLPDWIAQLDETHKRDGGLVGISCGFELLDTALSGLGASDLIVLAARPSQGKAQPLTSKILMHDGQWKEMADIQSGDSLASTDGAESVVTGIFPQGGKPTVRVTFSDGRSTECCTDHLWLVHHRKWPNGKVMDTQSIQELMSKPSMAGRLWVDRINGEFGNNDPLPINPWLLGALLGDGCMTGTTVTFSKTAQETLDRVRCALPETVGMVHSRGCDWRLSVPGYVRGQANSNPLTSTLKSLGLMGCNSYNKFVPAIYMRANRESRLGVLRGLLDTDGWAEKTGSVLFASSSIQLAQDAQALARSLGYWCKLRTKQPTYTYLGQKLSGATSYMLSISGEHVEELFLFKGKRDRCLNTRRTQRVSFQSIVPVGTQECQCISVSHPSHLYVTDDYVVTHNTTLAMNIAESVALSGKKALVFSMEMSSGQLISRSTASIGTIQFDKVRLAKFDDEEWTKVTATTSRLLQSGLIIDDSPALTVHELRARARRVHRSGLDLIVVDYLQLMSGEGGNQNEKVAAISRGLKALAKELNVPVIALSQLNRSLEQRQNKRPVMSDLRDSGAIEQDADVVLCLYRHDVYNPGCSAAGTAEVLIRKQRNGPLGMVRLVFAGHYCRFENYMGDPNIPDDEGRAEQGNGQRKVERYKGGYDG